MMSRTFARFSTPVAVMMLSLYTIYFVYAILGELLFGGKITTQSSQVYDPNIYTLFYLMNFNDLGASYVTLFHIMIVNNWYVTVDMITFVV